LKKRGRKKAGATPALRIAFAELQTDLSLRKPPSAIQS